MCVGPSLVNDCVWLQVFLVLGVWANISRDKGKCGFRREVMSLSGVIAALLRRLPGPSASHQPIAYDMLDVFAVAMERDSTHAVEPSSVRAHVRCNWHRGSRDANVEQRRVSGQRRMPVYHAKRKKNTVVATKIPPVQSATNSQVSSLRHRGGENSARSPGPRSVVNRG